MRPDAKPRLDDDDTKELLRVARRFSRVTGVPIEDCIGNLRSMIAREQVRHEQLKPDPNPGQQT
jgi:hypothetical protein